MYELVILGSFPRLGEATSSKIYELEMDSQMSVL